MSDVSRIARVEMIPWFSLLLIAAVFFSTIHDVRYTRYFAERGITGYIVTQEEAEQIMTGFEQGQLRNAIAYLILGLFGAASLGLGARKHLRVKGLSSALVIFFICWSFLSLFWADNVPSTAKKLVILAMLCIAIAGVLKRFSDLDILLLTFFGLGAYVAIGVFSEVALGSFRPWIGGYRFSGTCHPNGQALDCALLVFASWAMYRSDKRRVFLVVGGAALVLLILTKSRTSVAGALLAFIALPSLVASREKKVALISLGVAVLCLLLLSRDVVLPTLQQGVMMGRTDTDVGHAATLTGRTDLWNEIVNNYIAKRPLLGYGYNSFWTLDRVERVTAAVGFIPGNAHCAFLDVTLSLGIFGLVTYALINLTAIVRTLRHYRASRHPVFEFFALLLVFSMMHGLTESTFLFPSLPTFISMLLLARLAFQDLPKVPEQAIEQGRGSVPSEKVSVPA